MLLVIFPLITLLTKPQAQATVGGFCCPENWYYRPSQNDCYTITPGSSGPISCEVGVEVCWDTNPRGICQLASDPTPTPVLPTPTLGSPIGSGLPDYDDLPDFLKTPGFTFANESLGGVIGQILPYLFVAAGLILLVFIIKGGFQLLTSSGDPKSAAAGQKILTNAVIGFAIVIASYWLYQIIKTISGVPESL